MALLGCTPAPRPPGPAPTALATTGAPAAVSADPAAVRALLDELLAARHDPARWRALVDPADPDFAATAEWFRANLADLDLRLIPTGRTHAPASGRGLAHAVTATWSVPGTPAAEHRLWLTVTSPAGQTRLAGLGESPSGATARDPEPIWAVQPIRVSRADGVVLLASPTTDPAGWLPGLTRARAVLAERGSRPGALVAVLPDDPARFERLLGVRSGTHRNIAATAWPFGATTHLVVNPAAGGATQGAARQVLLTHEAVHVASDPAPAGVPLWLTEGYADLVALTGQPEVAAAHEAHLADDQRRHGIADSLVTDAELGADNPRVHAHYQRAWITVRVLDAGPDGRGSGNADRVHAAVFAGRPLAAALADAGWTESGLAAAVHAELTRMAA